ncbi:MAG: helix-turn-helix domain-containing protein [Tannerellaceae bacterium]|jgi:DNA-binding XRE family transcriptional regulator|nr:helix-turn-helix domain-containing protein [Tannerellaceae bacterium]
MKERIIKIMEREGMTAARFAEAIGAQRATMSHILSGRNNMSLEIAQKILDRFPKLSPDWLLRGAGDMYRNERTAFSSSPLPQQTLFSARVPASTPVVTPTSPPNAVSNEKQGTPSPPPSAPPTWTNKQENSPVYVAEPSTPFASPVIHPDKPSRRVTRIMIFYSDNTFDTFISEQTAEHHP